jgi:hypothetical protein
VGGSWRRGAQCRAVVASGRAPGVAKSASGHRVGAASSWARHGGSGAGARTARRRVGGGVAPWRGARGRCMRLRLGAGSWRVGEARQGMGPGSWHGQARGWPVRPGAERA